jgi:hypothetical protein
LETPYWAATSRTGLFSVTTAVITSRLIVIAEALKPGQRESGMSGDMSPGCLETGVHHVLNQNTAPATNVIVSGHRRHPDLRMQVRVLFISGSAGGTLGCSGGLVVPAGIEDQFAEERRVLR